MEALSPVGRPVCVAIRSRSTSSDIFPARNPSRSYWGHSPFVLKGRLRLLAFKGCWWNFSMYDKTVWAEWSTGTGCQLNCLSRLPILSHHKFGTVHLAMKLCKVNDCLHRLYGHWHWTNRNLLVFPPSLLARDCAWYNGPLFRDSCRFQPHMRKSGFVRFDRTDLIYG